MFRPDLHWRDLQRLCVETSVAINLVDPDWVNTTAGRPYNHKYGYGRLDAYRLVERARTWKTLGKQVLYDAPQSKPDLAIPQDQFGVNDTVTVTKAQLDKVGLWRLEHVTLTVRIPHRRRGDIVITLYSPSGQISYIATHRPYDGNGEGLLDWTFSSVKHWDEDPVGDWTLNVRDSTNPEDTGTFESWNLHLWGESKEKFVAVAPPGSTHSTQSTKALASATVTSTRTKVLPVLTTTAEVTEEIPDATMTTTPIAVPQPEASEGSNFFRNVIIGSVSLALLLGLTAGLCWCWRSRTNDDATRELYQFQQLPGGHHGVNDEDLEAFLADPVELEDLDLDDHNNNVLNGDSK
jgi:subtilisin-like proprotein convertase family protein